MPSFIYNIIIDTHQLYRVAVYLWVNLIWNTRNDEMKYSRANWKRSLFRLDDLSTQKFPIYQKQIYNNINAMNKNHDFMLSQIKRWLI